MSEYTSVGVDIFFYELYIREHQTELLQVAACERLAP